MSQIVSYSISHGDSRLPASRVLGIASLRFGNTTHGSNLTPHA